MELPNLSTIKSSNVFLRVDMDVPLNKGKVMNGYRIDRCVDTITTLLENKNYVVLFTKLGRPDGKKNRNLSTENLLHEIRQRVGNVFFVRNLDELVPALQCKENNLILFENTRFFKWEKNLSEAKAVKIAKLFDWYVDEAFAMSHRAETTNFLVPKNIKKITLGINYQKEIKQLSIIKKGSFNKPALFLLGGAKPGTKIPMVESLSSKFTYFLIGGKLAKDKLLQPIQKKYKNIVSLKLEKNGFDINEKSIEITKRAILLSKTVVWNGPVGIFEDEKYNKGTRSIVECLSNAKAVKIAGGGDTISAIESFGNFKDYDFVSTGGGAMFNYLSGKQTNIEKITNPKA